MRVRAGSETLFLKRTGVEECLRAIALRRIRDTSACGRVRVCARCRVRVCVLSNGRATNLDRRGRSRRALRPPRLLLGASSVRQHVSIGAF